MEFPRIILPFQLPFRRPHHTDCSIHGPLYPVEILEKTFRIHRLGEGYDPDEVDDYLDAIAASMMGGGPPVTAWDVRQHEFTHIRKRHFFDTEEVDDFLECIAQTLEGRAGDYPVEQYLIEYAVQDENGVEYTVEYAVDYEALAGAQGYPVEGYPSDGYPPGWLSGQDAWEVGYDPGVVGFPPVEGHAPAGQTPLEVYPPGQYPEALPWTDAAVQPVPPHVVDRPPPPPPPGGPHHGQPPAGT
jgi:DivIVA domain-containing protein